MSDEQKLIAQSIFTKLAHHSFTPTEFTSIKQEFLSNSSRISSYTALSFRGRSENMKAFTDSLSPEEQEIELDPDFGPQPGDQVPDIQAFSAQTSLPVTLTFSIDDPKVYLIDFWATRCDPCQEPMAHNQKMLENNPDWEGKADILCISLDDSAEDVNKMVEEKGWDKISSYWAGPGGFSGETPKRFYVNGIPKCLLVKNGVLLWVSHPSGRILEEDIKKLIDTMDINECKALFDSPRPADHEENTTAIPSPEERKDKMDLARSVCREFLEAHPKSLDLICIHNYTLSPAGECESLKYFAIGSLFSKHKPQADAFLSSLTEIFPKITNRIGFEEAVSIERGTLCSLCGKALEVEETQYLCLHCDPKHYHCEECQQRPREGKGSARLAHPHALYRIHREADHLDQLIFGPDQIEIDSVYEEEPESMVHSCVGCDNAPDPELQCEGPVVGTRFKCAHCGNYDFCQVCQEKWNNGGTEAMIAKAGAMGHLLSHVMIVMSFPS